MRILAFAAMAVALATPPVYAQVSPCVVADASCKESLPAVGQKNFWYFRSYPLQTYNADITRAVIVMHGNARNAPDYFDAVVRALYQDPSVLRTTVVIAPHFKGYTGTPTCSDEVLQDELYWSCSGGTTDWKDGGRAHLTSGTYSFTMIDRLVNILNDQSVFPNLTKITITGHSAGGQFAQRYAAGNQMALGASVSVKYVIANPGSYMYLDNTRLPNGGTCRDDGTCVDQDGSTARFTPYDWETICPGYNNYKYGLDSRSFGYMNSAQPGFSDDEVRSRFIGRAVAYLLGETDQLDNASFDRSCPANAEGSHLAADGSGLVGGRRERGTIFWNYMQQLGANHTLTVVPTCDHNELCMYSAIETIQAILF